MSIATAPEALPNRRESVDVRPLLPTPERLSQLLEMDVSQVREMYRSASERGQLVDQIMAHRDTLREFHNNIYRDEMEELVRVGGERLADDPDVSLNELETTLREVQQTLAAKRDFMEETSPHSDSGRQQLLERVEELETQAGTKKERGLWGKVWDAVTWLPREHPVISTVLILLGTAWGLSALWGYLGQAHIGLATEAHEFATEVGGAVDSVTPVTELTQPGSAIVEPGTGPVRPSGVTGYGDTRIPTGPALPREIP